MSTHEGNDTLTIRPACEADLPDIEEMVNDFVKGHPAEHHPRPRSALQAAYFGTSPVAHLVVAVRAGRAIGMGEWTLVYDMFWAMYGATAEWFYVRPEHRGSGVALAIVAEVCAQVRRAGGGFLRGTGNGEAARFYERLARGSATHDYCVSAAAFQRLADSAGLGPREIVRLLQVAL